MEKQPEISVVIVVWGSEHNLPQVLPALRSTLQTLVEDFEIVVSGDANLRLIAERHGAAFITAEGPGYGHILRAGLRRARGPYIITMDGDFSHRPGYVRTMWNHRDRGEVLIASRYVRGSYAEMPFVRRLLSRVLNLLYRKSLALPHRDLSSGFRMFRRAVLDDLGPPEAEGLDVLLEMVMKATCQGWKVVEVPFWFQGSKPWTRVRMVRLGIGFLRTLGRLFALRNSVKAADYDHRAFDSWIPLQRYWHRRRFRIIQEYVGDAGWVLDIGCGSSRIVQTLPQVVGLDLSIRKLRWLRSPGRHLVQADMNHLPFAEGTFDAVICSEVIEHIPREEVRLEEVVRVIRPGGNLILGTPDYGGWRWPTLEWIYGKVFPGGYVSEHVNPYSRPELHSELEHLGLEVLDCQYVGGAAMIFKARVPAARTAGVALPR